MANQWTNQNQKDFDAKEKEGELSQEIEEAQKNGLPMLILIIGATKNVTDFISFEKTKDVINNFSAIGYPETDCFNYFLKELEASESITVNWEANSYRTIY